MSSSTEKISVISTDALCIGYRQRRRVSVVNETVELELFSGELVSLMGLNGCGKSTLIKTLCGFLEPLRGGVSLCGKPLVDYSRAEISRLVGVVLTESTGAGGLTVRDLVSLGRYPHTGFFGTLSADDLRIVDDAMTSAGIAARADAFVADLSDGERQKAFIAKAVAQECPIIILDEPTAFLDVVSRIETMKLLQRLAHEQNRTILLSTHDLDAALKFSDRLLLLSKDAPLVSGAPDALVAYGTIDRMFGV